MRVMTVLGTRPEIIRLSRINARLDANCEHTIVHTGQNYDDNLSGLFYKEMGIRPPDLHLGIESPSFSAQTGAILSGIDAAIDDINPDRVVVLGDTNSGLSAIIAARRGIPVYHLEAGNRCYDDRVPEELNRRLIDHSSTVLMPYTYRSKDNLVREGIERERIFVIGNPIYEVILAYAEQIEASDVLERFGLKEDEFFLVTVHRAENVDDPSRLENLIAGLELVGVNHDMPVVVSMHPRTADKLNKFGIPLDRKSLRFVDPPGFFDFLKLEQNAKCVISDSGTVQEECCILGRPSVTIRDVTERPETIEVGSNILTGSEPKSIAALVDTVVEMDPRWTPPEEYLREDVSSAVLRIVLGFRSTRSASA